MAENVETPAVPVAPAAPVAPAVEVPVVPVESKDGKFFERFAGQGIALPPEEGETPAKPAAEVPATPKEEQPAAVAPAAPVVPETPKAGEALILGRYKDVGEVKKAISELGRELTSMLKENNQLARELGIDYEPDAPMILSASNAEETASAYREAESAFTKASQKRAEMRRQIAERTAKPPAEKPLTPEEAHDLLMSDPDAYIARKVQEGIQKIQSAQAASAEAANRERTAVTEKITQTVAEIRAANPDFVSLEPKIAKIISEFPQDINLPYDRLVTLALNAARGESVKDIVAQAKAEAADEAAAEIARRKPTIEGGESAGTPRGGASQSEDEKTQAGILAASKKKNLFMGG